MGRYLEFRGKKIRGLTPIRENSEIYTLESFPLYGIYKLLSCSQMTYQTSLVTHCLPQLVDPVQQYDHYYYQCSN